MDVFWIGFVLVYILQAVFFAGLEVLNLKHLRQAGGGMPAAFEGFIDESKCRQTKEYVEDKAILNLVHQIAAEVVLFSILVSGILAEMDNILTMGIDGIVQRGLLFCLLPSVVLYLLGLPVSYLRTFVIEEKYGFNRTPPIRWVTDHLKAGVLSFAIVSFLLALVIWLVSTFQDYWWVLGFMVVSVVQVLISILYPCCIGPLFNRFVAIRDELLACRIRDLMERNEIRVRRILEVDAGTRSRHTNAYFTGLGRTKQIVLFDTLLETHPHDEILAVLAHEAGHFKGRHILKQLIVWEVALFLAFYFTGHLLKWPPVFTSFGFDPAHGYAGMLIIAVLWQKTGVFFVPLFLALSRHFEREADAFAARLVGTAVPLATAFKRMAAHNLSNLRPHPLYVVFHYSHPPLPERIELLERTFSEVGAFPDTLFR